MNTQSTEYKINEGIQKNSSFIIEVKSTKELEELKKLFAKD